MRQWTKVGVAVVLSLALSGCWALAPRTDPVTGQSLPSPAQAVAAVLPSPWNIVLAALLPTVTTLVAGWEARRRGIAIKQVSNYADEMEKAETDTDVVTAKVRLQAAQLRAGTKNLVQKLRGKTT